MIREGWYIKQSSKLNPEKHMDFNSRHFITLEMEPG